MLSCHTEAMLMQQSNMIRDGCDMLMRLKSVGCFVCDCRRVTRKTEKCGVSLIVVPTVILGRLDRIIYWRRLFSSFNSNWLSKSCESKPRTLQPISQADCSALKQSIANDGLNSLCEPRTLCEDTGVAENMARVIGLQQKSERDSRTWKAAITRDDQPITTSMTRQR